MPSANVKHYLQFIHLLIEGGGYVLREFFIENLRSCGIAFNACHLEGTIRSNKQCSILDEDQYSKEPNVNKWDLALLCSLIQECIPVSEDEEQCVKTVRKYRNSILAHKCTAKVQARKFNVDCKK